MKKSFLGKFRLMKIFYSLRTLVYLVIEQGGIVEASSYRRQYTCYKQMPHHKTAAISLLPRPPHFLFFSLQSVYIMHGSERVAKNREAWEHLSHE